MSVANMVAQGVGFTDEGTKWIVTHGFGIGEVVLPEPTLEFTAESNHAQTFTVTSGHAQAFTAESNHAQTFTARA